MPEERDPERALERTADELAERGGRLDDELDQARDLLAQRAKEARGVGRREARHVARGEDFTGSPDDADDEAGGEDQARAVDEPADRR